MIIVAGKLYVKAANREKFVELSKKAVILAREANGCLDFVVAADPIEKDRVNVFEMWRTENDLMTFRGQDHEDEIFSMIERAEVSRHIIRSSEPN